MKILKEVLKVSIGVVCVCLLCVSLSMAAATNFTCEYTGCTGLPAGSTLDFKCSKDVKITCNSDGRSYAAISDHFYGDKVYGITSESTKVYRTDKDPRKHYDQSFTASDSSAFNGWSSL